MVGGGVGGAVARAARVRTQDHERGDGENDNTQHQQDKDAAGLAWRVVVGRRLRHGELDTT
jgi:hypothetical protein